MISAITLTSFALPRIIRRFRIDSVLTVKNQQYTNITDRDMIKALQVEKSGTFKQEENGGISLQGSYYVETNLTSKGYDMCIERRLVVNDQDFPIEHYNFDEEKMETCMRFNTEARYYNRPVAASVVFPIQYKKPHYQYEIKYKLFSQGDVLYEYIEHEENHSNKSIIVSTQAMHSILKSKYAMQEKDYTTLKDRLVFAFLCDVGLYCGINGGGSVGGIPLIYLQ
jgi:hypothetical protein